MAWWQLETAVDWRFIIARCSLTRPLHPESSLPVEIAFLARHGVAPSALQSATLRAARIGVEPAREIIASGLVSEEAFYRALACELGLRFQRDDIDLKPGGSYGAILREGIAPVLPQPGSRIRFALAPAGTALRRLLEAGPRQRDDVVVTTPGSFAAALRRANGRNLARHASGLDRDGRQRQSARTGSSSGQKIAAGFCIGPAAFCGTLAPFETLIAVALTAGPIFLMVTVLRLSGVFERPSLDLWRAHRWRVDDSRLPVYTVAVPLFREERVLPQLLSALAALDYPPAKLDIRLLLEEHDKTLQDALATREMPAHIAVTIIPAGAPQTKPRALNLALLEARGEVLTIFDAEDVPDPRQLRIAAARFLQAPADLACLQARLVIDNSRDGVLPGLFALEYAGLFDVLNPGLLRGGLPIMLGGTSNHFRVAALRQVGGWDAWNVTEDADLALRLVRAGFRMGDLPSHTLEEAPLTIPAWLKQRTRWIKGYIQTMVSHLQQPLRLLREAGFAATFALTALALGGVVSALGYPVFAVAMMAAWLDGSLLNPEGHVAGVASALALSVSVCGLIAIIVPPMLGAVRRGMPELLLLVPLLPFYYVLVSVAAWLAVVEYVTKRFAWNKTTHGLARSSRHRTLTDAATTPPPLRPAGARC